MGEDRGSSAFYDDIASVYHLVYDNWDGAIRRQGKLLGELIEARWPGSREVLDATCGIGTQALGLALWPSLSVTASDLSPLAIERAAREAAARGLALDLSVCDLRDLARHHGREFDVVLSCDNALPHLLTDDEILGALREIAACTRSGGGVMVSVRDYDVEPRGRGLLKPFGTRDDDGERWFVFQVWDFDPPSADRADHYDFAMYFVPESNPAAIRVAKSRYYAVSQDRLVALIERAGFDDVERHDGLYFQPLILGTRS